MTPLQTYNHRGIFCKTLNVVKDDMCSRHGLSIQREVTKRAKDRALAFDACSQANVASALSITNRAQQHTIMAEQLPNGDAPISADVEMKEESVAEV